MTMNRILALVFVAVHVSAEGFAALVVGVTDQHLDPDHNIVENCFVEALAAAGHVPVVVPCLTNDAALAEIVAKLDALVFTGVAYQVAVPTGEFQFRLVDGSGRSPEMPKSAPIKFG